MAEGVGGPLPYRGGTKRIWFLFKHLWNLEAPVIALNCTKQEVRKA